MGEEAEGADGMGIAAAGAGEADRDGEVGTGDIGTGAGDIGRTGREGGGAKLGPAGADAEDDETGAAGMAEEEGGGDFAAFRARVCAIFWAL